MSRAGDDEVPLPGGIANRGLVVRIGETVRRPLRPTSAATAALLRHLEAVGFDGAPRHLGVDGRGREVLSFIQGTAITPPYPEWALTEAALTSVADLLRRYHQAVQTFDPSPYEWPTSPPPPFAGGTVSHNDPNLDNIVFRDGRAIALIDFDLASPGSALWDVASAVRLWAPLRSPADISDVRAGQGLRRLRVFAEAYGVRLEDRGRLVAAIELTHDWVYEIVRAGADAGNPGYAEYWSHEGAPRADRSRAWLRQHRQLMEQALTGPR